MPPKKSVEELDAELAALEAELAALEAGEGPPKPKKAKKPKKAAPPPAPPAEGPPAAEEAPRSRLPLRLPKRAAPEGEAAPAKKRFALPFGRPKEAAQEPPDEAPPAEPMPESAPEPAPELDVEPEPVPESSREPPRGPPAHAWEARAGAWRARPAGPQKVEVVRRELDASGRVVSEEAIGEEVEAPPAPEPAPAPAGEPPRRFGFFGGSAAASTEPPEGPGEGEAPPPRKKRGWLVLPVLLLAAILLLALVLPALGIDPLGIGGQTGLGGGAAPTATFATSATVAAVGAPITFDASGTTGATEYVWDFGDGDSVTDDAQVTHTYQARGTYDVTLTARSGAGRSDTHTVKVTIAAPPTARVAATLNGNPISATNSPAGGDTITFSGGGSTADGGIAAYDWQFGDGARGSGAEATHAYTAPGSYRVTLQVSDNNGLQGNATYDLFVGLRITVAGELPASVEGPAAVNETVAVATGGGALPYAPAALRATLLWNATAPPVPIPGFPTLPADNLLLVVYDADGVEVARSAGGVSPQEIEVTSFTGALGDWNIEVSRPQGGTQSIAYQLEIELANGPG